MLQSSLITIVFIGNHRIVRCDVASRSGRVRGLWTRTRPPGVEAAGLVDAALRAGSRRPGRVWVLSTEFWLQDVVLSEETTYGLSRDEIGRLLAFEVESLSGLQAMESEVGFWPGATGSPHDYRVIQVPGRLRGQIDEVIRRFNGRFGGFAHPAGLPAPAADSLHGAGLGWLRVEAWPGSTVAVGGGADGHLRSIVVHADNRGASRAEVLEAFRASLGAVGTIEQLADEGLTPPAVADAHLIDLRDDAALAAWLGRWGRVLCKSEASVATVRATKRPMTRAARTAIALSLAAAVAGLCAWDSYAAHKRIADATIAANGYKKKAATLEAAKTATAALQKQIVSQQAAITRIKTEVNIGRNVMGTYRTRWPRLLAALATSCPAQTAITEISEDDGKAIISGTSVSETAIDQLAACLAKELHPHGWVVVPPRKSLNTQLGRSPCFFSLELREKTIGEYASPGTAEQLELPPTAPEITYTQR